MRRALLVAVLAVLVVPVARSATKASITPVSIAGARLGLHASAYKQLLGTPAHKDVLENNYSRLVFAKRKVEVYFKGKADKGIEITTWNKAYKTAAGIGPCSSVAQLRAAYGTKLKTFKQGGKVYAYIVGKVIFASNDLKHVTAVALGSGQAAIFVALNVTPCP